MARIFDNIEQELLGALRATPAVSSRADFCVGYLNLRGWQAVDELVQPWSAEAGQICRVLVGMQRPPDDEIRDLYRAGSGPDGLDNATAARLKTRFAAHLREQITLGIPTGKDEAALRTLARQLRAGQVCIKLFLPYPMHAKLYLLFRDDVNNPITGFVGSSNLTMQGLARQRKLNVDVQDHHATERLSSWFDLISKISQPFQVVARTMSYQSWIIGAPLPEVRHGHEQSPVPTRAPDARILSNLRHSAAMRGRCTFLALARRLSLPALRAG